MRPFRSSIPFRSLTAAALTALLVGGVAPSSMAQVPAVAEHVDAYSVLPPGQNGFIHLGQIAGGITPPHTLDQRSMYAALVDDNDVASDELLDYFKPAEFAPIGTIEDEYQPSNRVTVQRDSFGVPHVYGDRDTDLAFGLGYVTAEDRLWQIDVLRHAGKGELASLLGPDYLDYDRSWREAGYSEAELATMLDDTVARFGADGVLLRDMVEAFVDGLNARIAEVQADAGLLPAEYAVQNVVVTEWDVTDVLAVAILQEREFGLTSGQELENAALLQYLRRLHGKRMGTRMFRDLQWRDDPNSPTTIPASAGSFDDQDLGSVDPDAVAIPDDAARLARSARATRRVLGALGMGGRMSNMIGLHPSRSAGGHTLGFGAPQVGYTIPALLMEVDGHSPSFDFHGAALPGVSFLAVLGRGIDYAWSLTTGGSDAVDVRAEKLCEPGGGTPTTASNHYLFNGVCTAMTSRNETIEVKGGQPVQETFYRTVHGPVFERGTVDGEPVAFAKQMSFWMRELDVINAVMKWNQNSLDSVDEFRAAAANFSMSLNATYEDADGIGYFHMGYYPLRAQGVDIMLPTWGTGEWEWQGTMPFTQQPQLVNPPNGYFVNWNNQPSTGWDNGDSSVWGPTQRVRLMQRAMDGFLNDGHALALSDVVDIIRIVATQDADAIGVGRKMVGMLGGLSERERTLRRVVSDWIAAGAHRRDRNDDGKQDHGPNVALWDKWYDVLVHRIFDDELDDNYEILRIPRSDNPADNNGSSYYSDLSNVLWNLFRRTTRADLARNYCDDLATDRSESCAFQARAAFRRAVASLTGRFGRDSGRWTAPADTITFDELGAPSADPIPWQNRGTWNHAVEITGERQQ